MADTSSSSTDASGSASTLTDASDQGSSASVPAQWKSIVVTNPSTDSEVPAGYAVKVKIPAELWRNEGADLLKGGLALVHGPQATPLAIPYALDPDESWLEQEATVWFRLQSPIAAQGNSGSDYHFVWGDPQLVSQQDPQAVFLAYDDFSAAISEDLWELENSGAGDHSIQLFGDELHLNAQTNDTNPVSWTQIRTKARWKQPGLRMEARLRVPRHDQPEDCGLEYMLTPWSLPDNKIRSSLVQRRQVFQMCGNIDQDNMTSSFYFSGLSHAPIAAPHSYRYALNWVGTQSQVYQNELLMGSHSPAANVQSPSDADIAFGFKVEARKDTCASSYREIFVDWVYVRSARAQEPEVTIP